MGNPAAGVLVLLLALYLLLAFFQGRLEWLFRLSDLAGAGRDTLPGTVGGEGREYVPHPPGSIDWSRPTTTGAPVSGTRVRPS